MNNSILLDLVSTFSKKEWRLFHDFVKSPYFNKSDELTGLAEYLRDIYPDFSKKRLKKEYVYQKMFPGTAYDDKKMRYLMSGLFQLAKKFVEIHSYESEHVSQRLNLLTFFIQKKCPKLYFQAYKKLNNYIKKLSANEDRHFALYQLADLNDQYFMRKNVRAVDMSIQETSLHLDNFFLSKKLKIWCNMLDRQKIFNQEYVFEFEDAILGMASKLAKEVNNDEIYILYNLYKMLTATAANEYFYKVAAKLTAPAHQFNKDDLGIFLGLLINYSARKIREGEEAFVKEALDLHVRGIELEVFLEEGFLAPSIFKNMISLGLKMEKYVWVEKFINENIEKTLPRFQNDLFHFNMANLYFYQKEFSKTIEHLHKLQYIDIYTNLNGRVLLLKTYFHLNESFVMQSLISSFSLYIKRNKSLVENIKKTYLNFCNFLAQIEKGKTDRKTLRVAIEKTVLVTNKKWLLKICK